MTNTSDAYQGYIEMKGWTERFAHSAADRGLFEHEFRLALEDRDVRRLVDIGFGAGTLLSWARSRGLEAAGLEVQEALIREAKAAGFTVHADLADIPERSVDLVTCMDVVEHLTGEEMAAMLGRIRAILRPGGWLVIRTPNCQSPAGLVDQFGDGTHRQMLSGPILAHALRKAGFSVAEVRGAWNRAAFLPGTMQKLRRAAKQVLHAPAKAVVRLGFGLGPVILEPSFLATAKRPPAGS